MFVFVLSIGNFVTPALLGGGRFQMIGNLVYDQFLTANDWPFGAALSHGADRHHDAAADVAGHGRRSRRGARRGAPAEDADGSALPATRRTLWLVLRSSSPSSTSRSPCWWPARFNEGGLPTAWSGFSLKWYASLAANQTILSAALNSLIVAVWSSTAIATVLGTLLAFGVECARQHAASGLEALIFAPMIIPDIVLAIALLSFFTMLNMTLGLHTIVLAHVVFNLAFVCSVVRARLKSFDWSHRRGLRRSRRVGASRLSAG